MGSDRMEITRGRLITKALGGSSREQVIPLRDVTDLAYRRPTLLLNGYVRIAARGNVARPLTLTEANTHPDAVTFHHGQRREFDKLVSELQRVIVVNRSNTDGTSSEDSPIDTPRAVSHIPRTEQELADVTSVRPPYWEYRLFAGLLLVGLDGLQDKWHDHEFRYARIKTRLEDLGQAMSYLSDTMSRTGALGAGIERLLTPRNNELAFGAPGAPGDPNRIRILAARLMEIYEGFLDLAAELRSTEVREELQESFELAAQLMDEPVSNMRDFVNRTAVDIDEMIDRAERDELEDGHELRMELTLTVNDGVVQDYQNALERARKRLKI